MIWDKGNENGMSRENCGMNRFRFQRWHSWPVLFAVLLVGLGGMACQGDPYAPQYTRTEPAAADIVGEYVLQQETLTKTPYSAVQSSEGTTSTELHLTLRANGTFVVKQFPDWEYLTNPKTKDPFIVRKFVDFEGTWEITKLGFINDGDKFNPIWGIVWKTKSPEVLPQASLLGKATPYRIGFQYEDPDSGYVMIFSKNR